ncbi:MAG: glycosyltransferase family 2 protein [Deltaproteobacteria bacterium]|jgi:(heptosyl)LPS beta-1,4-glucosyltransferase|nr:glycosyltransferase family 2 protein [Deltaproteobacteria bacterium]
MLLSTVILTRNEKDNILACLQSARGLPGEILVLDHHSPDGTAALAAQNGARVLSREFQDFSDSRNYALGEAQGDWVFFLDADERVTPALQEAIARALAGPPKAYAVKRVNRAFGQKFRFGPLAPDRVIRLFPKAGARYEGKVHERPVLALPLAKINAPLEHFTYRDYASFVAKQEKYARLWVAGARDRGLASGPLKAVFRASMAFLKMFFLKLGILGGPAAWALSWYYSSGYTLAKYLLLADAPAPRGPLEPRESPPRPAEPR